MRIVALTFTKAAKRAAHRAPEIVATDVQLDDALVLVHARRERRGRQRAELIPREIQRFHARVIREHFPELRAADVVETDVREPEASSTRSANLSVAERSSDPTRLAAPRRPSASAPGYRSGPNASARCCASARARSRRTRRRARRYRAGRGASARRRADFSTRAATAATAASPSARCRSSHRSLSVASPRVRGGLRDDPRGATRGDVRLRGGRGGPSRVRSTRGRARGSSRRRRLFERAAARPAGGGGGGVSSAAGRASSAGVSAGSSLVAGSRSRSRSRPAPPAPLPRGSPRAPPRRRSRRLPERRSLPPPSPRSPRSPRPAAAGSGSATSGASAWATSLALSASSSSAAAATTTSADAPPPPSSSSSAFPASAASAAARRRRSLRFHRRVHLLHRPLLLLLLPPRPLLRALQPDRRRALRERALVPQPRRPVTPGRAATRVTAREEARC